MAEIKSFNGLRYNLEKAGEISKLLCPPYDIISNEQRTAYLENNSNNIIRLELPKGEDAYKTAGKTLENWMSDGILKKDDKAGIYVYEMEFSALGKSDYKVKGFISLVKLHEFSDGVILPHEETLSKAKQDRFNLMSETFCNFSQIYSLYVDEDNSTFSLLEKASDRKPDVEITDDDGVTHRLWCVYDEKIIAQVCGKMADKKLYIADGHHRYETALRFNKYVKENGLENEHPNSDHVMMMLVNMENDGLVVFPTHRVLHDLNNFDINKVISSCEEYFTVTKIDGLDSIEAKLNEYYANGQIAYSLYAGGDCYYSLVLKDKDVIRKYFPNMSDAYCHLDVSILHTLILEEIFGIDKENMALQTNLKYTRSLDEAIKDVKSNDCNCTFILNPTRVSEIRDVAIAGEKMPQKSTYFYPKLITGLVMNKF